jgi:hypothetical protein
MNLFDVVVLIILGLIGTQFWQIRAMTEMAHRYAAQYCKKHNLQLITVARESTKIGLFKQRLAWQCRYRFEFSANREALNSGTFDLHGKTVISIDVPAYPIN